MSAEAFQALVLPIALGLVGFIEPCSLGSTFLFLKVMEGKPAAVKAGQVAVFALVRGLVMGLLGTAAAFIGSAFFGFQRSVWLAFGVAYVVLGVLYAMRRTDFLLVSVGPRLAWMSALKASGLSGIVFALNIPACAAPLVAAVVIPRADRVLDWLAGWGRNAPVWTGLVLAALGVWSAWFGLYASIEPPP